MLVSLLLDHAIQLEKVQSISEKNTAASGTMAGDKGDGGDGGEFKEVSMWKSVTSRPLTCTWVSESAHPYLPR